MSVRVAWLLAALAVAGCAQTPASPPARYPGELVPLASIEGRFLWRQRVSGRFGERLEAVDAVVQRSADSLKVLLMTPFGTRGLLIEQSDRAYRVERFVDRQLPFEPRAILVDLHRVYFVRGPAGGGAIRRYRWHTEDVVERWEGPRLRRRTFTRAQGPEGEVVIDYGAGMLAGRPPPRVRLTNGWYGYELTIETLEQRDL